MEANKTHSREIGVYSRRGANLEANKILILNMERYELYFNFYHLSQQKSQFILGELKWRLTESIQVKLESIVDEEPVWMLAIS